MAHTRFMLDQQGSVQARACTRARVRTHSQKYVIFIAFPQQQ